MPDRRWFIIFILVFLLGVVLDIPMLVVLMTSLMVILGLTFWWQRRALDGVVYRRRFFYTRSFPGERVNVTLEVENRKILPLTWLRVSDLWPKTIGPENGQLLTASHLSDYGLLSHVFSLRWYGKVRRTYPLVLRKRGVYSVGPATLASGDLFGFFDRIVETKTVDRITVYPQLLPAEQIDVSFEGPFGDAKSRRKLFEDPNRPMGVREYRPEDGFRRVHWPATARTGELQVKVFQPTTSLILMLCLNVSTFARYWEGVYPALLEHLISVTATLALEGIQAGFRVGMISNGCLSNSDQPFRIPPGRLPRQLTHLLTALAGVTSISVGSFENFLLRESPRVPFGATMMIVTATVSDELAETLFHLKRHERRITLYSLAQDAPPELPGIATIHRPFVPP